MTNLKITEAAVTRQIRDYLKLKKIFHWKNFSTLGSVPGIPDVIGCLPDGRMLAIEIKTPTGKTSAAQRAFLDALKYNGALAFVARSVDDLIANGL